MYEDSEPTWLEGILISILIIGLAILWDYIVGGY